MASLAVNTLKTSTLQKVPSGAVNLSVCGSLVPTEFDGKPCGSGSAPQVKHEVDGARITGLEVVFSSVKAVWIASVL